MEESKTSDDPTNIDLYLRCNTDRPLTGGGPESIFLSMNSIKGDDSCKFGLHTLGTHTVDTLFFNIEMSGKDIKKFGSGAFTLLLKLEPIVGITYHPKIKREHDLLIRIFDANCTLEEMNNFITKTFNNHKEILGEHLIDMFYWGKLNVEKGSSKYTYCYIITRRYNTDFENVINLMNKDRLFNSCISLLDIIYNYDEIFIYRDFKLLNIGYDSNTYTIVIIDYDMETFIDNKLLHRYNTSRKDHIKHIYGTYVPYYTTRKSDIIDDTIEKKLYDLYKLYEISSKKPILDISLYAGMRKMYVCGLAQLMIILYFNYKPLRRERPTEDQSFVYEFEYPDADSLSDTKKLNLSSKMGVITSKIDDESRSNILKHILGNIVTSSYFADIYTPSEIRQIYNNYDENNLRMTQYDVISKKIYIFEEYEQVNKFVSNDTKMYDFYEINIDGSSPVKKDSSSVTPNLYPVYDRTFIPFDERL